MEGSILNEISSNRNRSGHFQVLFLDLEKYSLRNTLFQSRVIDRFTNLILETINFLYPGPDDRANILILPTGDGAALVFPFGDGHPHHFQFALEFQKRNALLNEATICPNFHKQGWCDCHEAFRIRAGLSTGRGILYRDANGHFNVAGHAVNMAARILSLIEPGQIAMTAPVRDEILDFNPGGYRLSDFSEYLDVEIKHGEKINLYLYVNPELPYLNRAIPTELILKKVVQELKKRIQNSGVSMVELAKMDPAGMARSMLGSLNLPFPGRKHLKFLPGKRDQD